jgi:putative component of toxin-antitoxin plasmid stabilization module
MNIEIREYIDARGHNHYREWLSKLDPSVRARIDKSVFRVGYGNLSGVKPEGEGVSACRRCGSILVQDTGFTSGKTAINS